jgi:hypothetical protein
MPIMIAIEIPDLEIFLSAENCGRFNLLCLGLTYFHADLALVPKTKFLLHKVNYKSHLRFNLKTDIETTVIL